jgi:hypothetical protein
MPKQRLDTARVFERVFGIYRAQATVLLPAALIVSLVPAALVATGSIWLPLAASFICNVYFQGMVVQAVRDIQDSVRNLSLTGLLRSVGPAFAQLLWTAILLGICVTAGVVALLIPGLILGTMWSVAIPVVVCEDRTAPQALGRSARLVRGYGWAVFSVLIVMALILFLLLGLAGAVSGSGAPAVVASLVANTLTAPLFAIAASVVYLELLQLKGEPLPPADMASFTGER